MEASSVVPLPPAASVTPVPAPLFARDQILDGNYRIVDGLAAGGMGEVYVAVHLRLPRRLAIKTLQPELAARHEWISRFCREACVLAQLHHPNIVQVIDFNVAPSGVPYIAMELVEGVDLGGELERGRRFEIAEVVAIIRQVASALGAAHAAGIVHRDLKPENVVLTPAEGQLPIVKVIDFGISMHEGSERVTGDATVFGTPDYMAPEQAQGMRDETDARTDQFALAALAYTLLAGRTPFKRATPVAVLYAVVHEEPAALGSVEGWDSAPVERVLRRAMSRERDDRYESVLAFADAFEAAFVEGSALPRPTAPAQLPAGAPDDDAPPRRASTQRKPARRGRGLASLVVVSALVVAAFFVGSTRGRALVAPAAWPHRLQEEASQGIERVRTLVGVTNAKGGQGIDPVRSP